MTFLFGFLGALAAVVLAVAGAAGGWQAHRLFVRHTCRQAEPPKQAESRRLEQEQKAFQLLQNYSAERAYGMMQEEDLNGHRGTEGGI